MEVTEAGAEVIGLLVKDLAAYLYLDVELVTSAHTERLHRLFYVVRDLFNRVGLWTNIWKTFIMAFWP